MTTKTQVKTQVKYYDCFDTGEYERGEYSHPYIRLIHRYGENLEYTGNMQTIEFQCSASDKSKVYAAHFDYLSLQDFDDAALIVHKIQSTIKRLHLYTDNQFLNVKTALYAMGLIEIKFNKAGDGYCIV